ncbi:hypothetical protein N7504_001300 [Penicillium tannophilum]|nr:hypothetical protein N7504_001300 [Penicillium tannophilum]
MFTFKRQIDGSNFALVWHRINGHLNDGVQADGNWVSDREGRIWRRVFEFAYEDKWTAAYAIDRILEYWIDCGTRRGGWDIPLEGPSRGDWERFKRESKLYKAWRSAPEPNRGKPDLSGFKIPYFEAQGFYLAILRRELNP